MCRFLMVKSRDGILPQTLMADFAAMCQKSRTLEGYSHGDGWGVALQIKTSGKQVVWQQYKSLKAIWKDTEGVDKFPKTKLFVVHARSASFSHQKGVIAYNQPYLSTEYAFVFNGMLNGVNFKKYLPGDIGAQKIWSLVQFQLEKKNPYRALKDVNKILKNCTKGIEGMNIGLAGADCLIALCGEYANSNKFFLKIYDGLDLKIICSEAIGHYHYKTMEKNEVICL